jgi:hypothetical protein
MNAASYVMLVHISTLVVVVVSDVGFDVDFTIRQP